VGTYRQVVTVTTRGAAVPDGDGGYVQAETIEQPTPWRCAIEKVALRLAERAVAGSLLSRATHQLVGRWHPTLTTQSRISWQDRAGVTHLADVIDVDDVEGAGIQTQALVVEILP
jgi:hypothetical protein